MKAKLVRVWAASVMVVAAATGLAASTARAQFKEGGEAKGARLGEAKVERRQFGATVSAVEGPARNVVIYVPVPVQWPEQQVTIVGEDVPPGASIAYQTVEGNVKMMVVRMAMVPMGEQLKAAVTVEVRKHAMLPPADTSIYQLPDPKKLPRDVKPYLAGSPEIQTKGTAVRAALKKIDLKKENAWEKVQAIFEWVGGNIERVRRAKISAERAIQEGKGSPEDIVAAFVALCRAADIPARTVWVSGHCYAEFYLLDDDGAGHWFPCELLGTRMLGGTESQRPIIEKGDDFRSPINRRDRKRYLPELVTMDPGHKPKITYCRSTVADPDAR
jgi:hypothetical protein